MSGQYEEVFHKSIEHTGEFWGEAARDIHWYRDYSKVLDSSNPPFYHWFPDGEMCSRLYPSYEVIPEQRVVLVYW